MDIPATISSGGQVTIPAPVRKALGIETGDRVVFRLIDGRALIEVDNDNANPSACVELEKPPDFFALAGSVPVPSWVDPSDWQSQREAAWTEAVRDA